MAGSTTAAPAPRPFERYVGIYSRGEHDQEADHYKSLSNLSCQASKLCKKMGLHGSVEPNAQAAKMFDQYQMEHEAQAKAGTVSPELIKNTREVAAIVEKRVKESMKEARRIQESENVHKKKPSTSK